MLSAMRLRAVSRMLCSTGRVSQPSTAAYDRYQTRFTDVFLQFKGRLPAADGQPQVIEGRWRGDKLVLMSFPDEAEYRDWSGSAAYRAIASDRIDGAGAVVRQVLGIDGAAEETVSD